MTENEAILIAQKIFNGDDIYIMLSSTQANMVQGYSTPYIGILQNDEKLLFLFTSYERAKAYIDEIGYEVLDGMYPIAKIDPEDKYRNIHQICNIAINMGIENVEVDLSYDDAFGCKILWLLNANGKQVEEPGVLISKEEAEAIMNKEVKSLPIRFNAMNILNFEYPYNFTEEQAANLFKNIFEHSYSFEELKFIFENKQSLIENCYLADRMNSILIPRAINDQKEKEAIYFGQISMLLEKAIWKQVFEENKLFTMADKQTGNIIVQNQSVYLVYTDRFKYIGQYDYVELSDKETFMKVIKDNNINKVVVTDGPNYMCVLNEEIIFEE